MSRSKLHKGDVEETATLEISITGITEEELALFQRSNKRLVEEEVNRAVERVIASNQGRLVAGTEKLVPMKGKRQYVVKFVRTGTRIPAKPSQNKIDGSRPIHPRLAEYITDRPRHLASFTLKEAAERLGVAQNTLKARIAEKRVIAWKGLKKGFVIPAEQFTDTRGIVDGVHEVNELIGNAAEAWDFLSREYTFQERVERPIERLRKGRLEEVLKAAEGYGATFT